MSATPEPLQAERERIAEILNREWPYRKPDPVIRAWKEARDQALRDLDRLNSGRFIARSEDLVSH